MPAFDKNVGISGTFITGEQIYNYSLVIKDINAETIVYEETSLPSNKLNKFTIPAFRDDTLENGTSYLLYIRTFEDESSINYYESDPKIIKCISTPSFHLNIFSWASTHYILKSTTLNVGVNYLQSEQEPLNEYYVIVKDSYDNEIYRSDLVYKTDDTVEINDLENYKSYSVCAYGKTLNGMEISTEDVIVDVDFVECNDSSVLSAKNNECTASVTLTSSIKTILYQLDNPPVYDPQLDLTDNVLEYYDGINIDGDFSMFIKFSPTELNSKILTINNGELWLNFRTNRVETNLYEPFFEFYTKNGNSDIFTKMVIIDKNELGNTFSQINTSTYSLSDYGYDIKLSRISGTYIIKIKDWRE